MSRLILLIAAISVLVLGGFAAVIVPNFESLSPGDSLGGNYPVSLRLIGNVDGKSYFAENATTRNWVGAGVYCAELGMHLATITSQPQATLLANANADYFNGTFWTAGRDAHQLRQFSWNKTENEQPNSAFVRLDEHQDPYLTCLSYHSNATAALSHMDSAACASFLRILCES